MARLLGHVAAERFFAVTAIGVERHSGQHDWELDEPMLRMRRCVRFVENTAFAVLTTYGLEVIFMYVSNEEESATGARIRGKYSSEIARDGCEVRREEA